MHLVDNFGRILEPGARIIYRDLPGVMFVIEAITPELDPQAPPDTLRVTLGAQAIVHVTANHPVPQFLQVLSLAEIKHRQAVASGKTGHASGNGHQPHASGEAPADGNLAPPASPEMVLTDGPEKVTRGDFGTPAAPAPETGTPGTSTPEDEREQ